MKIPIGKRHSLYINSNFVSSDFSVEFKQSEFEEDVQIETFEKVKVLRCSDDGAIIKESINAIREELSKHGYLYNAFLFSILSAIKEYDYEVIGDGFEYANKEVAENILKRIIGEE